MSSMVLKVKEGVPGTSNLPVVHTSCDPGSLALDTQALEGSEWQICHLEAHSRGPLLPVSLCSLLLGKAKPNEAWRI